MAAVAYRAPFCLPRYMAMKCRPSLFFAGESAGFCGGALSVRRWRRRRHGLESNKVAASASDGYETITACNWNQFVLASDLPVLVEFWAQWCGPCIMVRRIIEEISEEYTERINFYRIDADNYPQIATHYGIDRIPTVLLFKGGEKVESLIGTLPKSVYVKAIEKSLS
ncbi:hypothetical protein LUZ60_004214 [Juncus effusus]|nr:hypothetical protein LUZ60_004214 [Juncus effusus]